MLILRGPEPFAGGRVVDSLVSHIDLYPTICELVGIPRPPFLQGVSLLPLLRGEVERARDEIFAGSTWHAAYEPQRAIRTERFKYIRRWGDRRRPVLPNTDDGPSKELRDFFPIDRASSFFEFVGASKKVSAHGAAKIL